MKLPPEAGALIVDLRPGARLSFQVVLLGIVVVFVAAMPVVDRTLLQTSGVILAAAALFGVVFGLIQMLGRHLRAICENGLAVRHRRAWIVVPWTSVRGLRTDWIVTNGRRRMRILIDTDGKVLGFFPDEFGLGTGNDRTQRAVAAIEAYAGVRLVG
ncbi:MAG TPA: hypothetical protein VHW23_00340 [Kofleriaceae bacterium]|jgi:hypothetical protein|nr:hypothetical protein [Kofleriaceae bacterium]